MLMPQVRSFLDRTRLLGVGDVCEGIPFVSDINLYIDSDGALVIKCYGSMVGELPGRQGVHRRPLRSRHELDVLLSSTRLLLDEDLPKGYEEYLDTAYRRLAGPESEIGHDGPMIDDIQVTSTAAGCAWPKVYVNFEHVTGLDDEARIPLRLLLASRAVAPGRPATAVLDDIVRIGGTPSAVEHLAAHFRPDRDHLEAYCHVSMGLVLSAVEEAAALHGDPMPHVGMTRLSDRVGMPFRFEGRSIERDGSAEEAVITDYVQFEEPLSAGEVAAILGVGESTISEVYDRFGCPPRVQAVAGMKNLPDGTQSFGVCLTLMPEDNDALMF